MSMTVYPAETANPVGQEDTSDAIRGAKNPNARKAARREAEGGSRVVHPSGSLTPLERNAARFERFVDRVVPSRAGRIQALKWFYVGVLMSPIVPIVAFSFAATRRIVARALDRRAERSQQRRLSRADFPTYSNEDRELMRHAIDRYGKSNTKKNERRLKEMKEVLLTQANELMNLAKYSDSYLQTNPHATSDPGQRLREAATVKRDVNGDVIEDEREFPSPPSERTSSGRSAGRSPGRPAGRGPSVPTPGASQTPPSTSRDAAQSGPSGGPGDGIGL